MITVNLPNKFSMLAISLLEFNKFMTCTYFPDLSNFKTCFACSRMCPFLFLLEARQKSNFNKSLINVYVFKSVQKICMDIQDGQIQFINLNYITNFFSTLRYKLA